MNNYTGLIDDDLNIDRCDEVTGCLYNFFYNKEDKVGCILFGKSGTGKTEIVNRVLKLWIEEKKDRRTVVHYDAPTRPEFDTTTMKYNTYESEFWSGLSKAVEGTVKFTLENIPQDEELVIVIDKFEHALNKPDIESIVNKLVELPRNIYILLLSRRSFDEMKIVKTKAFDKFSSLELLGFTDFQMKALMNEMWKKLNQDKEISDEMCKRVQHYCGNNPKLLHEMYQVLVNRKNANMSVAGSSDVDMAFEELLKIDWVKNFYEEEYKRLLDDYVADKKQAIEAWAKEEKLPNYFVDYAWNKRLNGVQREMFIGREKQLKDLLENIFSDRSEGKAFYAVTGPNEVGKTSLVQRAIETYKKNGNGQTIIIEISLPTLVNSTTENAVAIYFWKKIFKELHRDARIEKWERTKADFSNLMNKVTANQEYDANELQEDVRNILKIVHDLKFHLILSIDEFESAKKIKEDIFFDIFTELHRVKDVSVSVILQGRGSLTSPTYPEKFVNIFTSLKLTGFDENEMEDFKQSLGIVVAADAWEKIQYYCGKHPRMLMAMREALRKLSVEELSECAVEKCYKSGSDKSGTLVRIVLGGVAEHLTEIMSTEMIDKDTYCIDAYLQIFKNIPIKRELFDEWKCYLCDRGFVVEEGEEYRPISDFVNEKIIENSKLKIRAEFIEVTSKAELAVRKFISEPLLAKNGNDVDRFNDEIIDFLTFRNRNGNQIDSKAEKYLESLNNLMNKIEKINPGNTNRKKPTVIDVLSYPEYFNIITSYWEEHYAIEERLSEMKEIRDAKAHENDIYLDEYYKEIAIEKCLKIIQCCNNSGKMRENPLNWKEAVNVGDVVDFEPFEYSEVNESIKGYMFVPGAINAAYRAIISCKNGNNLECKNWIDKGVYKVEVKSRPHSTFEYYVIEPIGNGTANSQMPTQTATSVPNQTPVQASSQASVQALPQTASQEPANTSLARTLAQPTEDEKNTIINTNPKKVVKQKIYELEWETARQNAIIGYIYSTTEDKKFKVRFTTDAVKNIKKKIGDSAGFPEYLEAEVKTWNVLYGCFNAEY